MRSALLLAGRDLRELHLPFSRFDRPYSAVVIMEDLSTLYPRLEKLDVGDDPSRHGLCGIDELVDLKLRSLSISGPYPEALDSMVRSPEELCLTSLCPESDELLPVLRLLPKRLYLQFVDFEVPPRILECLNEVCPKIEELTVKLKYYEDDNCYELRGEHYGSNATRLLNTRRSERSARRKLVLCTGGFFRNTATSLLRHVHPEAVVEISFLFQTYVYDGKELYPKALPLWDICLMEDLSKLSEISVTYVYGSVCVHPMWKSLLVGKHFSRVWVENGDEMGGLYLEADVVEVPLEGLTFTNWRWLGDVKEVRITEWWGEVPETKEFLWSLANLLDTFQGKLVSMEYCPCISLKKDADSDVGLFDFVVRTLNAFEVRGGDASAVRGTVERIRWT